MKRRVDLFVVYPMKYYILSPSPKSNVIEWDKCDGYLRLGTPFFSHHKIDTINLRALRNHHWWCYRYSTISMNITIYSTIRFTVFDREVQMTVSFYVANTCYWKLFTELLPKQNNNFILNRYRCNKYKGKKFTLW